MTDSNDLRSVPIFSTVPAKRLPLLRSLLTTVRTSRTMPVVKEGTLGQEFLVLAAGTATVTRKGETIASLQAGDVFGEAALLTSSLRNATVVVDADSELLAATPAEFRTILDEFPEVAQRIEALALSRAA